jgi:multicomponent Na+:H+ antiporter subunit A
VLVLVLAHFAAAVVAPALVAALGRRAFGLLAVVPAASVVWAVAHTREAAAGDVRTEVVAWVPGLGLDLAFAFGALQWAMALVVAGVGTLVLVYCAGYFTDDEPGLPSFAAHLTAFAGAMLGLVLADDLLLMYVFWELTTVFSYLLIGHDPTRRVSRAAGLQALLVTTFGGLAMLVGILVLGLEAGTFRVSELAADVPTGPAVQVAVLLLLLGALTKSALFPFHFWLPAAMAAPTPVSAYLHAAAMVKAGVYLVALLAPMFAELVGWRAVLLPLGVLTMLLGGWRSLRQHDLKLLLAYGTVSQLGFLVVVVAAGTPAAALAGVAMLLAHALFKAALFMVVGIVDKATGTRDLRTLSGLGRAAPMLAATAVLAGASMAGLPPLAGFVAKESVFGALVDLALNGEEAGVSPAAGWLLLAGVVAGAVLTVAYTARFLWGAFAVKPGIATVPAARVAPGFLAAPVVLAALCVGVGLLGAPETTMLAPYADSVPSPGADAHDATLTLWHGFGPALWLSVLSVGGGLALFWRREGFGRVQVALGSGWSTEHGYLRLVRRLDRVAVEVTGLTQRGSVGAYVGVILLVVVLAPGAALVAALLPALPEVRAWDSSGQVVVVGVVVLAAFLTTQARRRLKAVLLVGVTGYGTAMLFLLHGAPDLALTQVLVETVTLVVFVLVLRRLPEYFTDRPLSRTRYARAAIGAAVAAVVAGLMLAATAARTAPPVSVAYPREAVEFGGGRNIVNVTLVDIRAWDTLGEISVLVAAATGVASLVFIRTRSATIKTVDQFAGHPGRGRGPEPRPEGPATADAQGASARRRVWLPGGRTLPPERRSVIFEVVTRLLFHTVVVFSLYLLFSGHNNPGGGFSAGLVTGLALVVRYLAGGRYELDEAAPVDAGALMGTGLFAATVSALAPLLFGGTVLQSAVVDLHVPALGTVHLVTSLFFDVGVYVLVVGLVLDVLRSLGSAIDRHILHGDPTDTALDNSPVPVGAAAAATPGTTGPTGEAP